MKLISRLTITAVCAALGACSLQAVDPNPQLVIRLEGDIRPRAEADLIPNPMTTYPPPSTFSGFDCYAVNVTGQGIPDTSHNPEPNPTLIFSRLLARESYCSYRGLLAGPLYLGAGTATEQEVAFAVPPGNPRIVQLIGIVERGGSTDCVKEFQPPDVDASPLPSPTPEADVYEVGRAIVDLFQDRTVQLLPDWDALTTQEKTNRQVKCNNGL